MFVERQRVDLYKDLTTKGELTGVTVQPVGHLRIVTSSTEFHAFKGCDPGEAVCDGSCVDVQSDPANCGDCGKACDGACIGGSCNGIEACNECAEDSETGVCKFQNDQCAFFPPCKALETCIEGCQTQQCINMCAQGVDGGIIDMYNKQIDCVCQTACVVECSSQCT
ncbi:hypothetical protein [Nannocystis radixulma]|uniref:Uncharacterized protein n=1 Tax=Nannocystis radixulma TaxID=2995305 RepID=A0ABT5BDC1_9BACT|nr:hypothetical protein [Nannocystis radixulma]MDC0672144.1 hypothetical protein [Nannocystis radixulma]